jgi:hypothetical protein
LKPQQIRIKTVSRTVRGKLIAIATAATVTGQRDA